MSGKTTQIRPFLLALVVVLAVGGALWWSFAPSKHQPLGQRVMESGQSSFVVDKAERVVSEMPTSESKKKPSNIQSHQKTQDRVLEPKSLSGFLAWSPARQLDAVTKIQDNPHLDQPIVAFFIGELSDRQLDEVTRNNIANALLIQDQVPVGVSTLLANMIDDHKESSVWRSYAVQHLATAFVREQEPFMVEALTNAMSSDCTAVACTAMIQLNRLQREKVLVLDDTYDRALMQRLRTAPANDPMIAMTTLSILGERGVMEALPIVRETLANTDPHVRRVAIATVGRLGTTEDSSTLQQFLTDDNELVVLAARGALHRLENIAHAEQTSPAPASPH